MKTIRERFLGYVKINTESDPKAQSCPTTKRQWDLAYFLKNELENLGLHDVVLTDHCYLYATLPANTGDNLPVIGFIAHMDTSPDFSGENVNPQIVENYDGGKIILNKGKNMVLDPEYFPELSDYKGQTLITTDGTTLLGADDKAGITAIVSAMEYLMQHPEIKHGIIKIAFTPDEEVGKGSLYFDVDGFGADWAYTVDGGALGELEFENFNAAGAKVIIKGKSVHPGYAFGKMVNAALIAADFIKALPAGETPATTKDYQGFYHLMKIDANVSKAEMEFIIRDFDKNEFENRKKFFRKVAENINDKYAENVVTVEITEQYSNMLEKIKPVMHIVDLAQRAMEQAGVKAVRKPIRGGTDGAQLSFKGLPCPNIFTGGHNFHGPYEYIPEKSMQKAMETVVNICNSDNISVYLKP